MCVVLKIVIFCYLQIVIKYFIVQLRIIEISTIINAFNLENQLFLVDARQLMFKAFNS